MSKKMIVVFVIAGALTSVAWMEQVTQILVAGRGIDGYVTVGATTSTEIKTKFGAGYKEVKHYTELQGTKTIFSVEHVYAKQGISFYYKPNKDTVFCVKVKPAYKAKTDKGIAAGTSTMQEVRDAYGNADFYSVEGSMFLEY